MIAPGHTMPAHRTFETDCFACHSDHKGVKAFRPIGRFSHDLLKVARRDRCSECHQAPLDTVHQGPVGACGQCHSQQAWTPATFDHEALFSLVGDHQAACATCHVGRVYSTYTCYGCHEHTRSEIREKHAKEGIVDYERCVKCHRGGDADEGGDGKDGKDEGRGVDGGTARHRDSDGAGHGDGDEHGKDRDKQEDDR